MKFNEKPHFPYTYGDKVENDNNRISDIVVKISKNKRVQNVASAALWAGFYVGSNSGPAIAVPIEYGEAAAEAASQASQTPAIGKIEGLVNTNNLIPKMTPQQQRIIAAQQAGKMGSIPTMSSGPSGPAILDSTLPVKDVPWYIIPGKPETITGRTVATGVFFLSTTAICSQAAWNPIAAAMCATGLAYISYNVAASVTSSFIKFLIKNS